jgi:signal transduction histidine kinase
MHRDWERYAGSTPPRHRSPRGPDGPGRRIVGRTGLARRRTRLSHQRPNRGARGVLRALRYATERKRLERLKDEFVSTVSHELRTPLTSISGSLGLLMGNAAGSLPKPMARLLAIAHTNSQRLVRLVNDILDIEKMQAGRVVFNFSRVEVRPLVAQAIEANRGFAEGYGVRVRLEDACLFADVRADPDRLLQVVTNLLSNAIKFSPARIVKWWSRSRKEPTWSVLRCATTVRAFRSTSSRSFSRNLRRPMPETRGRRAAPVLVSASSSRSSTGSVAKWA